MLQHDCRLWHCPTAPHGMGRGAFFRISPLKHEELLVSTQYVTVIPSSGALSGLCHPDFARQNCCPLEARRGAQCLCWEQDPEAGRLPSPQHPRGV